MYHSICEVYMKLSDYIKNKGQSRETPQTFASPEDAINAYSRMSEEDLTSEMMRVAGQQKADGTFDPAELERLCATMSPMLTPEQNAKMRRLIEEVKR